MKTVSDITNPAFQVSAQKGLSSALSKQNLSKKPFAIQGEQSFSILLSQASVTVQKGNTLSGLTHQWLGKEADGMSSQQLNKLVHIVGKSNGLTDLNRIFVGQVLDFSALKTTKNNALPTASSDLLPSLSVSNNKTNLHSVIVPALPTTKFTQPTSPAEVMKQLISTSVNFSDSRGTLGIQPQRTVIVGDSIAVGIGGSLLKNKGISANLEHGQKNLVQNVDGLLVEATIGISSSQILQMVQKNVKLKNAEIAVISAGTNDVVSHLAQSEEGLDKISHNLRNIRSNLNATRTIWVVPYDPQARDLVTNIANEYGDDTVSLSNFAKADRYHPKNYGDIAKALKPVESTSVAPQVSTLSFLKNR